MFLFRLVVLQCCEIHFYMDHFCLYDIYWELKNCVLFRVITQHVVDCVMTHSSAVLSNSTTAPWNHCYCELCDIHSFKNEIHFNLFYESSAFYICLSDVNFARMIWRWSKHIGVLVDCVWKCTFFLMLVYLWILFIKFRVYSDVDNSNQLLYQHDVYWWVSSYSGIR